MDDRWYVVDGYQFKVVSLQLSVFSLRDSKLESQRQIAQVVMVVQFAICDLHLTICNEKTYE